MSNERKIPLLNEFVCRGRVIGKGGLSDQFPYLTIFVKSKRKPNYLRIYFDSYKIHEIEVNQHVYVEGILKSRVIPYLYEGKKDQFLYGQQILVEKTELEEVFQINNIGFAHKHPFSRVYLSGSILAVYKLDGWIKIQVRDFMEQVITLQFSENMRVSDLKVKPKDFVFLSAMVVSKRKLINNHLVHFEDLIVDDLVVK